MPSSTTLPQAATSATGVPVVLRKRGQTPTEVNLLKLAKAAGGFDTKKEARESLRNAGFIATTVVVEALLKAACQILAWLSRKCGLVLTCICSRVHLASRPFGGQASRRSIGRRRGLLALAARWAGTCARIAACRRRFNESGAWALAKHASCAGCRVRYRCRWAIPLRSQCRAIARQEALAHSPVHLLARIHRARHDCGASASLRNCHGGKFAGQHCSGLRPYILAGRVAEGNMNLTLRSGGRVV